MSDEAALPKWFNADRHVLTHAGLVERDTGLILASDGLPAAGVPRAARLRDGRKRTDPLGIVADEALAAVKSPAKPAIAAPDAVADAAEKE